MYSISHYLFMYGIVYLCFIKMCAYIICILLFSNYDIEIENYPWGAGLNMT